MSLAHIDYEQQYPTLELVVDNDKKQEVLSRAAQLARQQFEVPALSMDERIEVQEFLTYSPWLASYFNFIRLNGNKPGGHKPIDEIPAQWNFKAGGYEYEAIAQPVPPEWETHEMADRREQATKQAAFIIHRTPVQRAGVAEDISDTESVELIVDEFRIFAHRYSASTGIPVVLKAETSGSPMQTALELSMLSDFNDAVTKGLRPANFPLLPELPGGLHDLPKAKSPY